jgi:Flp pilus assembly protein TadB
MPDRQNLFFLVWPAAIVSGVGATWWANSVLIGVAVGAGMWIMLVQVLAARRRNRLAAERGAILALIDRVSPLTRSGIGLDAAVATATARSDQPGHQALNRALAASTVGQQTELARRALKAWPLSNLTYRLCLVHREQGGSPEGFLRAFRNSLGMAEDLAKKRRLALIQIRWQANIMTVFFFIVLLASVANAAPFFSALIETEEGRFLSGISGSLVIWGRVVLNVIEEWI